MQTVSATYRAILSDPRWLAEHRAIIAGEIYTQNGNQIGAPTVTGGLFSKGKPAIGCCVSRQLDIMVMPMGDIPRMAEIRLETRLILKDPLTEEITSASEWLPKGTFYIDTRRTDTVTGALVLHCYDAMLKAEQIFLTETTEDDWPKPMDEVVVEIAARMGVSVDERTVVSHTLLAEYPLDYTMREILGYIAVAHAGNWIMTDAGALRLVGLADTPRTTNYLVDDIGSPLLFGDTRILI